jgi:putative tryptophan/tyrosine transport system substrate-binding protein
MDRRRFVIGPQSQRDHALERRRLDRLPDLAAELLKSKPDVVVAAPVLAAAAVHKHNGRVPIVVMWGAGAVKIGLAKSFARPELNVTGLETQNEDLTGKHLELLKTVVPGISRVGVLNSGNYIFHEEAWRAARESAQPLKLSLIDVRIGGAEDLPRLAAACGNGGCDGLYVRGGGRARELFAEHRGHVPPRGRVRRQDFEGCQARRPVDRAAAQV